MSKAMRNLSAWACVFLCAVQFLFAIGAICLVMMGSPNENGTQNRANWVPHRHYDPEIEEALDRLQTLQPEQAQYIRTTGLPIELLGQQDFVDRSKQHKSALAITLADRSRIFLRRSAMKAPDLVVAAISHEMVHVEHADGNHPLGQHSPLLHWALWTQEDEAHFTGTMTLHHLGRRDLILKTEFWDLMLRPLHSFLVGVYLAISYLFFRVGKYLVEKNRRTNKPGSP